jgi:hypothetical protein
MIKPAEGKIPAAVRLNDTGAMSEAWRDANIPSVEQNRGTFWPGAWCELRGKTTRQS